MSDKKSIQKVTIKLSTGIKIYEVGGPYGQTSSGPVTVDHIEQNSKGAVTVYNQDGGSAFFASQYVEKVE